MFGFTKMGQLGLDVGKAVCTVGRVDGAEEGTPEGCDEGLLVGFVGLWVGDAVGDVGAIVGGVVGLTAEITFLTRQLSESGIKREESAVIPNPCTASKVALVAAITSPLYPDNPDPA